MVRVVARAKTRTKNKTKNKNRDGGSDKGQPAAAGPGNKDKPKRKTTKEYPGKNVTEIPEADRVCAYWFWFDKKTGKSLCTNAAQGKPCPHKHVDKPTDGIKQTNVWAKLKDQNGGPNGPPKGDPTGKKQD